LQRAGFESGRALAASMKWALTGASSRDCQLSQMELADPDVETFLPLQAMHVTVQHLKDEFESGGNMITLRDISSQKKAEQLQRSAETAAAASEMKTDMMQMLSHELRTPLQASCKSRRIPSLDSIG